MNLTCVPRGHGRYAVRLDDRTLCASTETPFFDGARALAAEGASPELPLTMTYEGSSTVVLRSTIGRAARSTVVENKNDGPRFARYRALPDEMAHPPVRVAPPAAESVAPAPN